MKDTRNKPWVSNYPPLKDWLDKINAWCIEQTPIGNTQNPVAYWEKWCTPNGRTFIVEVRYNALGWNVFTDSGSSMISETLDDAEIRLKIREDA